MDSLTNNTNLLRKLHSDAKRLDWDEGSRMIDACESFFVEEFGEVGYLNLVIVLVEAKAQAEVPISIGDSDFGFGRPIQPDSSSRRFVVEFSGRSLFSYMVMDEIHGKYPQAPEEFTGKWLRVFSRSHLMDFTLRTTQHLEELNGPMRHIAVVTQHHAIDVICSELPMISVLE